MRQPANRVKGKVSSVARTRLVKIGKSRGICLPRLLLDQVELDEEVELEVQDGQVIVRPVPRPRLIRSYGVLAPDRVRNERLQFFLQVAPSPASP